MPEFIPGFYAGDSQAKDIPANNTPSQKVIEAGLPKVGSNGPKSAPRNPMAPQRMMVNKEGKVVPKPR